ncbi:MAG: hypothetical protein IJS01_11790 [Lentisphaeria bacterium]|nr:hypothetical protein [Lentisphaeria bacterium]
MRSGPVILLILLLSANAAFCRNDLSDLRGLTLTSAKIPIYNRGGKPQMMIFVTRAERRGRVISGTATVLDFIRPTASVDDIGDAWKLRPYPLKAPFGEVFNFWLPRMKYSEAVVTTARADIDQETRKASGSDRIFLRSPLLDLNGIGFEADFDRREIRVNSEIEVVLRTAGSDPRKLESIKNKKHGFISATGDSLLIELAEKRIMLIGSVVIREEQATITCDRLTILLSKNDSDSRPGKRLLDAESEIAGLSRVLADGNIVISGTKGTMGRIYADHLIYDLRAGKITLTSDTPRPAPTLAQIREQAPAMLKADPRAAKGFVVIDDPQSRSYGMTVLVDLRRSGEESLPAGNFITGMTETTGSSGVSSVQRIVYPQGLVIAGKETPGKKDQSFLVCADHGEFRPDGNAIDLKTNVFARDSGTVLTCDAARLDLKKNGSGANLSSGTALEAIRCRRNVKLHHTQPGSVAATLLAEKADFLPEQNKIVFSEKVRGRHEKSTLDCDRLDLFLADRRTQGGAKAPVQSAALREAASSGKTLDRAVAAGNVVMTDPGATLRTGQLTLYFREAQPGEKTSGTMLQSGGAVLTRVECDSGVRLESTGAISPSAAASHLPEGVSGSKGKRNLTAMRSVTEMAAHVSTFSGNVHVYDELSHLKCQTLKLYGARTAPLPSATAAREALDADPYDMTSTENFAPSRIAISGDLELDRVECIDDVVITHKTEDRTVAAGGDHADYKVKTGRIVITGRPPRRPWVQSEQHRQESDRLIYHLKEERFESLGDTETSMLDPETEGENREGTTGDDKEQGRNPLPAVK